MKLKCKRRQHAQAIVSSLSHLSLLHPLLSLSHAHTHAHTLGLPYKFLSDRVAVVSPCFPICFGCVRTSVLANAAVIIHGTNCVYYNIPLRLANKRTAVQTDSRTEVQPDRQAGQARQTSDCEGQQRPQWSFISRTLRHFDLHCKKELEASACVRAPWAWRAATCGSYLSPSEKARDCVSRFVCVCGPTRHALISQASHKWSPHPTHTHWLR